MVDNFFLVTRRHAKLAPSGAGKYKGRSVPRLLIPASVVRELGIKNTDTEVIVTLWKRADGFLLIQVEPVRSEEWNPEKVLGARGEQVGRR